MLGLLALSAVAHVPTYSGCSSRCCQPPHHHSISQVIYSEGTSGLEIHFSSLTEPFDILGGEIIDIDVVFKFEYNPSTYNLYIGCGGCVPFVDPVVIDPLEVAGYEPGVVEPFTGTAYKSIFPKEKRKFNTSKLKDCDQGHFTIRIIDLHNRTNDEPLIWGAVVGLGETFTFTELLSFPIYVLRNHGSTWNDLGWTIYVVIPFSFLDWWVFRYLWKRAGWKIVDPATVPKERRLRARLYDFAIVAFSAAALEEFVHLCYAQSNATFGHEFWVGFVAVILFSNGFPILITVLAFNSIYHPESCAASNWWIPVEMLSAFSYLLLFGAGFYIGPILVFLAACVRLRDAIVDARAPAEESEKLLVESNIPRIPALFL